MLKKATSALFLSAFFLLAPALVAADVPDWVRVLAKQPVKTYADDVQGVILLQEQITTVKENGEIVQQGRLAIRVLTPDGRNLAIHPVFYDTESRVNYLHGWSITSKGQEYESKDIVEQSVSSYEVYSDKKMKAIRVPGVDVGSVVAFDWEQQERPYIFQNFWSFQSFLPVEKSSYQLHLAHGWRFRSEWINHEESKPSEENGALIWRLADIPRIENEAHRPSSRALAATMVVTFLSDKSPEKSYTNWSEFGAWYDRLAKGMRDSTPPIKQKVDALAPQNIPMMDRIKALANFAQHDVRYVEVQIGVGGWRPHSAGDTFTNRYGDCKDKATVLSSMLAQIGVKSYYVLVNTERGTFKEKSPPQARFDHMIIAIALPDASYSHPLAAMYEHAKLGHLLIFDPTNEWVPFGQMPSYEQDNYGLLVGDQGGEYIHLPVSSPESNGIRRTAKLKLTPDGTLQGDVEEVYKGFNAMGQRRYLQHATDNDRKKIIEYFLGNSVSAFKIDNFELVNTEDHDKDLIVKYQFTAEHYAKNVGGLLLVRLRVVGELAGGWDPNKPRHYAYDFPAPFLNTDQVEIALPGGFKVDELPEPAKASYPFGQYSSKTEIAGNLLKYSREYRATATEVDLDGINDLKKLFSQINVDEKSMAILKKNN
ncbi:MAG TPA: DUF3857 domain-containing transglutaminase family protein [Candidatus Saccharimonadales bacterium]|jgi:hypothetical protein|nr:DUF3857 domain-containing transglutaminase family protein [Candidatus Saccharimonadales bacterium]